MRMHDGLLPDDDRALRELTEALSLLGDGPAPTPNDALRMFMAEQQMASLPRPREAAEALRPAVLGVLPAPALVPTPPSRAGRHHLAGRIASLGLMTKVLLGGGVALAGVTGAGAVGALPPVLQDAWDNVADEAAPGGAPAVEGPSAPARESAPGSRVDPAPPGVPGQDAPADRPMLVEQQGAATSIEGAGRPAPDTEPALVGTEPVDAVQDAPQHSSPAVEQAPAPPAAPSSETHEQGSTAPQTGTASGDAWVPVPDIQTTVPATSSTAPPPGTTTWEQEAPTPSAPAFMPSDAGTSAGTGTAGSGSGTGTGSGSGAISSGSSGAAAGSR